eukprot:m.914248 g.914248  ORF g.914248 m.914248 type:complete len:551 (+) comp60140_c0_seq4:1560-3212(+)
MIFVLICVPIGTSWSTLRPFLAFSSFELERELLEHDVFKELYYERKFGSDVSAKQVADQYLIGMTWVLKYYMHGCESWSWFYPFYYAPFASDFTPLADPPQFDYSLPFSPFQQLMAVLPASSAAALPPACAALMTSSESVIAHFYPNEFAIDRNGKQADHLAVIKLPFIDDVILRRAFETTTSAFTDDERERNSFGPAFLFVHQDHGQPLLDLALQRETDDLPSFELGAAQSCALLSEDVRQKIAEKIAELKAAGAHTKAERKALKLQLEQDEAARLNFHRIPPVPDFAVPVPAGLGIDGFVAAGRSTACTTVGQKCRHPAGKSAPTSSASLKTKAFKTQVLCLEFYDPAYEQPLLQRLDGVVPETILPKQEMPRIERNVARIEKYHLEQAVHSLELDASPGNKSRDQAGPVKRKAGDNPDPIGPNESSDQSTKPTADADGKRRKRAESELASAVPSSDAKKAAGASKPAHSPPSVSVSSRPRPEHKAKAEEERAIAEAKAFLLNFPKYAVRYPPLAHPTPQKITVSSFKQLSETPMPKIPTVVLPPAAK